MRIPARARLTLLFSALFSVLLISSSALIYFFVAKNLRKDFRREMVHDGRIMSELFKEELRLNALDEFKEEIAEFEFDLQVLDENNRPLVQSDGWRKAAFTLDPEILKSLWEQPVYREIELDHKKYALFSRPVHIPQHGRFSLHLLRPTESMEKIPTTLLQWMLIVKPFMVIFAALFGFIFSGRILRAEEKAFDRLKRFTADAAHELRIPLTALRGTLEVALRKDRSPNEYQEALRDGLEEAERLSQLTQDLLLLAQSDEKSVSLIKQSVELKPFLEDVLSHAKELPNQNQVQIISSLLPNGRADFDPDRIFRLLLNLIDNAIKYNRPQGTVTVGAALQDKTVQFIVQDTGIGVPKSEKEKIFERFYRVDKARSREIGGSGLGLSIARWIVNAHQGRIEVESEEGKGTTFTVSLPR